MAAGSRSTGGGQRYVVPGPEELDLRASVTKAAGRLGGHPLPGPRRGCQPGSRAPGRRGDRSPATGAKASSDVTGPATMITPDIRPHPNASRNLSLNTFFWTLPIVLRGSSAITTSRRGCL